jgi:hypothetical protein
MFFNWIPADGDCGRKRIERLMNADTKNATVVNKPKTFWARTMVECIMAGGGGDFGIGV